MSQQPASTDPPLERLIAGKYRLVRSIGIGGMGAVHEAVHVRTQGRVAIKVLSDEAKRDEDSRVRFAREARASGRLRSRHVARVLDVDALDDGTPYIVMEYLEGQDLSRILKERRALPMSEVAAIMVQAAAGVAEAHAAGIIHRDLKPGNVFLAEEGAQRIAKVLDFGISKVLVDPSEDEAELTRTLATVGTPGYMSPEQIKTPRDVDASSDVWAMGVMLYRLLSGRVPFVGNASSVAVAICHDQPPPLDSPLGALPADVVALVHETLEKDRRLRPTIGELAEVLVRHLDDSPSAAIAREAFVEITRLSSAAPMTASSTGDAAISRVRRPTPSQSTAMAMTPRMAPPSRPEPLLDATRIDAPRSPSTSRSRALLWVPILVVPAIVLAIIVMPRHSPAPTTTDPASTTATTSGAPIAATTSNAPPTIASASTTATIASSAPSSKAIKPARPKYVAPTKETHAPDSTAIPPRF